MLYPLNTNIINIQRIVGSDRYGQPKRGVVETNLTGCLIKNTNVIRNAEGGFSEISGTLYIVTKLTPQDQIMLENGDKYFVHSVSENLDVTGLLDCYSCQLVKSL